MNPIAGMTPLDASMTSSRLNRDPKLAAQALDANHTFDLSSLETELGSSGKPESVPEGSQELQEAFQDFVGQTLFGSMLASMRKTLEKPAYMHGGRAEEIFQQQLDQHIVDDMTKASADSIAGPMYDLFNLQRRAS